MFICGFETFCSEAIDWIRKSHRLRIVQMALALLVALSIGLFGTVDRAQASAPSAPQIDQTYQEDLSASAETETPIDDAEALDGDFLRAYDRLATDGAETVDESNESAAQSDPASLVSTLAFSLLVIVGLIYGGIWLYKQIIARQRGGLGSLEGQTLNGQMLTVQESQSIGPNQRLHVVRLGEETLLLGATDQTISLLARYDSAHPSAQTPNNFADHLQEAVRSQQADSEQTGGAPSVSLQESLAELRRVQQTWQGKRADG